jgi:hypothetical protein
MITHKLNFKVQKGIKIAIKKPKNKDRIIKRYKYLIDSPSYFKYLLKEVIKKLHSNIKVSQTSNLTLIFVLPQNKTGQRWINLLIKFKPVYWRPIKIK